ncbi:MAG: hypothetical protein ABFS86_09395 [Planctomycetota bacterium]
MRALAKTILTLLILVASIGGVYYVYRARTARQDGGTYSIRSVPTDLARDVAALFEAVERAPAAGNGRGPAGDPDEAPDGTEAPGKPAPERTLFDRANEHYMVARYADAEPLLLRALSTPGGSPGRPAELLARTRLFLLLLSGTRAGSGLEGLPIGYLIMTNGRPMLVRVTEETPDEVSFRAPGGIRSSVKKKEVRSVTVGHTRAQKLAIFEREYRLRHETTRTAGEFLDLARFSSESGLVDHVTYCMERAIAAPGDDVLDTLTEMYESADPERQALIAELLRRFYPRADISSNLYRPDVTRRPIAKPEEVLPADPDDRPSGIGGTGERKTRPANGEVAALLAEAEEHRKVGDEYYRKAFAGGPKASDHKDKALAAYRKAQEIYERVEQKWNVGLERTFKDIQTRVYDLLKSIR